MGFVPLRQATFLHIKPSIPTDICAHTPHHLTAQRGESQVVAGTHVRRDQRFNREENDSSRVHCDQRPIVLFGEQQDFDGF